MVKLRLKISHVAIIATFLFFGACSTKKQITRSVMQPVTIEPLPPKLFDTIYRIYQPQKHIEYITIPKAVNSKDYYETAFKELKAMLQGTKEPNFERAVFISENPHHNNKYTYEEFQKIIDVHLYFINQIIAANDKSDSIDFNVKVGANGRFKMADIRHLPDEKKVLYKKAVANWAIFTYITDTVNIYPFFHNPFSYATHDPFGKKDWTNSQVINLLYSQEQKGNCYTFTALYKILADRLNADARLCTAPQHLYIQHRDKKGDYYNVELATAGHPGDGTIQTLTHTTTEAIMSGISLRSYDERQSIGLCLVNLAKSYEHKFNTKDDAFMLRCAELALQYDSLNLNALLLKQQILDERVTSYAVENNINDISKLKANPEISKTVIALEKHLALLYRLGYRQMPFDMQKIIMTGVIPENYEDKNPSPFTSFVPPDEHRRHYHGLYGGLFQEVFETREFEPYGHFTFKTANNSITLIDTTAQTGFLIDPVAFAYDFGARMYDARLGIFTSVDPLAHKLPSWSPYVGLKNNPILYIDPDGKFPIIPIIAAAIAYYSSAKVMERSEGNANVRTAGYSMLHPINASQVYFNSNVTATNFQVNIGRAAGLNNRDGGGQNAVRHTLWQALNTRDMGAKQSSRVGYAHETTANIDLNKRVFGGANALDDADRTIDLLNNQIGRAIGEQNKDADNVTMAKSVVNEYYKNGLWTAKAIEDKDGNVVGQSIQKTKLTKDQYNAAMSEIDKKGQDGLNKSTNETK